MTSRLHQSTLPQPPVGLADDCVKVWQVRQLAAQAWFPQAPERVLLARQHSAQGSRINTPQVRRLTLKSWCKKQEFYHREHREHRGHRVLDLLFLA